MKYNRLMLVAVATGACMFFACDNSKDYTTYNDSTSEVSKQTAVEQQSNVDTMAMNNGGSTAPAADTVASTSTPAATSSSASAGKANPAKKGHKGQVRLAKYSQRMTGKMEEDKNGVYNYTEVLPQFPGGQDDLEQFVQNHIQYPQDAIDNGVEGTVYVTFAVDETGKVYAPSIKGDRLGYGLDDEALRVINLMPKWTPGRIKGKNVKTYYDLPITFTLL
ncbi:MAG TPA: energy transducer TonB [Chitinophagaceae bacterium]|nr:energy transducer TonB [Chitinophagaceae bacterium]